MFLLKDKKFVIGFLFFFLFSLISIVNHYSLRTFFDLGMVNQALYQIGNLQSPLFTLGIDGINMPFLATHFSPIIYLYYPIFLIFGSYTPSVIQILIISLAGYPIYKFSKIKLNETLAKYCLLQFYLIWGIYAALAFDFHNNVIGSMILPWIFLYADQKKYPQLIISSFLMLICMETFGIWLFFIFCVLFLLDLKKYKKFNPQFPILAILSLIYSLAIIFYVMPSLQNTDQNLQFLRFSHLGNSLGDIVLNLFNHPVNILKAFYINFNGGGIAYQKLIFMCFLIFSGGFLLYKNPILFLMFFVPVALKFLSSDVSLYGIYHQYSIEFVPLLSFTFILGLGKIEITQQKKIAFFCCVTTLFSTFLSMSFSLGEYDYKANSNILSLKHYQSGLNLNSIKEDLKLIPNDVSVSTSSCLSPYLYKRSNLYHFPIIKDSKYIAVIKQNRSTWPITEEEHKQKIMELKNLGTYTVLIENNDLIILKKN
ncbi:hypothetical protein A5893_07870 [Pedobacter psychrophilus]|uniref:DUF2079 domain-containing protein n=1 Tax=Pedobacter psychrophilus TaxID=1826909 RepID=A0A179DJI2_9SPHI|nr:DUF2079 domain-containing protein [Pedobacter psychrophilus]OAQ40840.1 hypothetical protein A5893_07870 [Pedobacter psychrophilus]